jgi:N-acyl-D-amino-acid deacylase
VADAAAGSPPVELIVAGGHLIDGTGAPRRRADVAVAGGRVVAVGDLAGIPAVRRVEAAGRLVTPGFVDLLGHSYYSLFLDPGATSKVLQGVTLEVTGERLGAGPVRGAARELVDTEGLAPLGLDLHWIDHDSYGALLGEQGTALNVACTVPAALLRASVTEPWRDVPLTRAQFDRVCRLLAEAFAQGAVSLSLVLEEAPCCFFRPEELERLVTIAREYDRLVMFHLRDEGAGVLDAVAEVLGLLRRTGARGEILHLKVLGAANWHLLPAVVDVLEGARTDGVDVQANVYPYTAAGLALQQLVDGLARRSPAETAARLRRSPALRRDLMDRLAAAHPADLWSGVRLAVVPPGAATAPFSELAGRVGTTPVALAVELLAEAEDWVHLSVEAIADSALDHLYARAWVGVASDGSARHPGIPALANGPVHPREYGTFPRFLREFVRTRGILDEAAAIGRVTSRAADRLRLADRGRLVAGAVADLVVFDPDRFVDRATFEQPNQLAVGMDWVVVNGRVVVREGTATGDLPGAVVRPSKRGSTTGALT